MSERIEKFVREVSRDFNIPPPDVIVSTKEAEKKCPRACGCYDYKNKRILIREDCLTLGTLLHELFHHYQYITAGEKPEKAFRNFEKPHCSRPHEIDAKNFADVYSPFYRERWGKLAP